MRCFTKILILWRIIDPLPDLMNSPNALLEYNDQFQRYRHRFTMLKMVVGRKSSISWGNLDPEKSQTKGTVCCSKNVSEEVLLSSCLKSSSLLDESSKTSWLFSCVLWMDAEGWSDLSKSVRQVHPKAETNWFHRGCLYHPGGNASQGGYRRAPLLWSPCR
jgi:hypothetical protein